MSYDLNSQHMTIVLALPSDRAAREEIVRKFAIAADVDGARVTALSIGDAISELERVEALCDRYR